MRVCAACSAGWLLCTFEITTITSTYCVNTIVGAFCNQIVSVAATLAADRSGTTTTSSCCCCAERKYGVDKSANLFFINFYCILAQRNAHKAFSKAQRMHATWTGSKEIAFSSKLLRSRYSQFINLFSSMQSLCSNFGIWKFRELWIDLRSRQTGS